VRPVRAHPEGAAGARHGRHDVWPDQPIARTHVQKQPTHYTHCCCVSFPVPSCPQKAVETRQVHGQTDASVMTQLHDVLSAAWAALFGCVQQSKLTSCPLSLTRGRRPFLFFFSSSCAALALVLVGAVTTSLHAAQRHTERHKQCQIEQCQMGAVMSGRHQPAFVNCPLRNAIRNMRVLWHCSSPLLADASATPRASPPATWPLPPARRPHPPCHDLLQWCCAVVDKVNVTCGNNAQQLTTNSTGVSHTYAGEVLGQLQECTTEAGAHMQVCTVNVINMPASSAQAISIGSCILHWWSKLAVNKGRPGPCAQSTTSLHPIPLTRPPAYSAPTAHQAAHPCHCLQPTSHH
jgi:hypothetical protein